MLDKIVGSLKKEMVKEHYLIKRIRNNKLHLRSNVHRFRINELRLSIRQLRFSLFELHFRIRQLQKGINELHFRNRQLRLGRYELQKGINDLISSSNLPHKVKYFCKTHKAHTQRLFCKTPCPFPLAP